jgi:protein SCO1
MPKRQIFLLALAAIAGFSGMVLCIAFLASSTGPGKDTRTSAIGGPFALVDDTGAPVTESALAGKPYSIYFGYTYCPEVCPTTLLDLSRWIKDLGTDADKLNYIFVTVDPERDTPQLMHAYLLSFDKRIRGFTGTPEQIAKIAREYRVYYKKIPTKDGGYVMDHSSIIYLMGPDGKFISMIAYQENDASAVVKLRNLVALTPSS